MVILGVDPGKVRTGLAICDSTETLAFPLCTLVESDDMKLVREISDKAAGESAELIVLGLPRNMDGSEGESARRSRELGRLIEAEAQIKVDFCDERGTTLTAHGYLNETNVRGKKRRKAIDSVAATVILQNYLDGRKNSKP